ncbi:MAG: D-alanyl-D-alanine carboxypeptidase/D-alanyl-D-alanine-endopeptidase [Chitinophagaceae bacterium]|nr:D-alanyl-D-alanine carboxypeptidase/D-alanyl-D-alanine-endopeptidase [Chitinophagaceae bacterium]
MKLKASAIVCLMWLLYLPVVTLAQTVSKKVEIAFQQFEKDSQLANAISSLYIIDDKTGEIIFDKNSRIGLAPASTQKIITSITAFELLGRSFTYSTSFAVATDSINNTILYIIPSGDPTLGSSRWQTTKAENVLQRIIKNLPKKTFTNILIDSSNRGADNIPDGWIWQDVGNYYGAGSEKLTWRENQFDILLKSGNKIGDPVSIAATVPSSIYQYTLQSFVTSAQTGSGDNAYIYFPVNGNEGIIKGTIPVNETRFAISGAFPSGSLQFVNELNDSLMKLNLMSPSNSSDKLFTNTIKKFNPFHTETSPPLDSIIFWLNRKSINLYAEALIKTIGLIKKGYGSTDNGLAVLKDFWKEKDINPTELNMFDGSGLSPLNRTTTHAQVQLLKYAKQQPWFASFYQSLPLYNGMKMKSGTITNVKGFTGYHTAASGKTYIFSFLVNNYNGSATALVRKMYKVLDELK